MSMQGYITVAIIIIIKPGARRPKAGARLVS